MGSFPSFSNEGQRPNLVKGEVRKGSLCADRVRLPSRCSLVRSEGFSGFDLAAEKTSE